MAYRTALLLAPLLFSPALWASTFVYVSNADSSTVSRYRLNEQNGALTLLGNTPAGGKIMPLAVSPDKKFLYGALRSKPWSIVSWSVNGKTGDLQALATEPVSASLPWIATDKSGKILLGASYDSDVVISQRIDKGVVTASQIDEYKTGPHAHSAVIDNSNHAVYVGNLGTDRVLQLALSKEGEFSNIGTGYVEDAKNSGPRHSVISPDNRFLYNLAEMAGTVTQYRRQADGALQKVESWPNAVADKYHLAHGMERSTIVNDPTPRIWAADIKITADGRFLYVTERTSSTVSGYKVNPQSGALTSIGNWRVEQQPRSITLTADNRWLLVTGEKSAVVGSYAIDQATGVIKRVAEAPCGQDANWVVAVTR